MKFLSAIALALLSSTALAQTGTQANLTWTAPSTGGAVDSYNIYRCQGASCTPTVRVGNARQTSYRDTGLTCNQVYTWAVKAMNDAGESPSTTPVSATMMACSGSGNDIAASLAAAQPYSRVADWTHTGVPGGIPHRTNICTTLSAGASAANINSAINACNNGVVLLGAGVYNIGSAIQVYKSNVTLRGAGADQTILKGGSVLFIGSGGNIDANRAITGATMGSNTFTVSDTSGLLAGTMIEVDRDNDTNLIVALSESPRSLTQVNVVTGISGNIVTVRNPWFYDFTQGTPRLHWTYSATTKSGVEDLKVDHTGFTSGSTNGEINYCDSCWLKGVESGTATGYHFIISGTVNIEIRDSFIHDGGSGPNNGGLTFYGNYTYGTNSSAKIENNIFNKDFPAIQLNHSSNGLAVLYNYVRFTVAIRRKPRDLDL
jgi:hypothetical protein